MQANNNKSGFGGFKARTTAAANSVPAVTAEKKTTGKPLFRVKKKGDDGKWITLGSLFENTDKATGDVFYSFSAQLTIEPGIHRVYDATPPAQAGN